jgi:cyclin-dependent kinase-like
VVLRCQNKLTGELVAIKKFKGDGGLFNFLQLFVLYFYYSEEEVDKKTILREVKILKMIRHINIVNLIEAFKRRNRLYLVFEFCEKNMLEVLESPGNETGLDPELIRFYIWQLCLAISFCHANNVIHRGM